MAKPDISSLSLEEKRLLMMELRNSIKENHKPTFISSLTPIKVTPPAPGIPRKHSLGRHYRRSGSHYHLTGRGFIRISTLEGRLLRGSPALYTGEYINPAWVPFIKALVEGQGPISLDLVAEQSSRFDTPGPASKKAKIETEAEIPLRRKTPADPRTAIETYRRLRGEAVLINGGKLRSIREEKKITRQALSKKSRISYFTILRWEMGQANPQLSKLKRVCQVLKIEPSSIMPK